MADIINIGGQSDGLVTKPVGEEEIKFFTKTLKEYKAGKAMTEQRILSAENWWKLRNTMEENHSGRLIGMDGEFAARSGWLHNVIVSKHADAMEAYPEPNILAREQGDKAEAMILSAIIPCVLEQNKFEQTYSDCAWQKLKYGTGVYKVVWDSSKLNGLGDISVQPVNLLNIYWEPGVTDIQQSRFFFHTELMDKDIVEQMYPDTKDKLTSNSFLSTRFLYDDSVSTDNKVTVVEVYYKQAGVLHYCKYVNDIILYSTENEQQSQQERQIPMQAPAMPHRGLYDHGMYPYVFDALYPIEGSPCGYGYVEVCRNPQTEIDIINTAIMKNAAAGATPRFFSRGDGGINEEEFLDTTKPIVHVNNLTEDAIRQINVTPVNSIYLEAVNLAITELRQTSGNTESSTGNVTSGVTAASAIAALQEASGKGSRDSTLSSYRAFSTIVELCVELIRQFYDLPRQFRIVGQYGMESYITYTNQGIQPQYQGNDFGQDMGFRKPVFDVKISAQKKSVYTRVSQNELALQLFQLGFFNPQLVDQAMMCLDMMDFDGKDGVMQKVGQQGTVFQKLLNYMQMTLMLAQESHPEMVQGIAIDIMQATGGQGIGAVSGASPSIMESDNVDGMQTQEHAFVEKARAQSEQAAQPAQNGAVKTK